MEQLYIGAQSYSARLVLLLARFSRSQQLLGVESCLAKSAQCYKTELFYNVVEAKRGHWFAVTLIFTPCGDRQRDIFVLIYSLLMLITVITVKLAD